MSREFQGWRSVREQAVADGATSAAALLQGRHVDHEAILDVAAQEPFVGLVQLLDADFFDVASDAVLRAEVEHLLRFRNTANQGARKVAARKDETENADRQRLPGRADQRQGA